MKNVLYKSRDASSDPPGKSGTYFVIKVIHDDRVKGACYYDAKKKEWQTKDDVLFWICEIGLPSDALRLIWEQGFYKENGRYADAEDMLKWIRQYIESNGELKLKITKK